MAEDRRVQENRRNGIESARRGIEQDRRISDRRRQQIYEDSFDPTKDIDLGTDPEPDWDTAMAEWDREAPEPEHKPLGRLGKFVFGDEFDDRREEEARAARRTSRTIGSAFPDDGSAIKIPTGAKERVFGGVQKDIALQGLNRRVQRYGVAGTLADMAAAYSLADGTPVQRGIEAGKAGLMGAGTGALMQGAINLTGKLGSIAGRGIPLVGAGLGAWNIGKAARGAVDWASDSRGAEQERLASEAKWGSKEQADITRRRSSALKVAGR